eukprot:215956-Chlamydomonas_euryale.AAC.2
MSPPDGSVSMQRTPGVRGGAGAGVATPPLPAAACTSPLPPAAAAAAQAASHATGLLAASSVVPLRTAGCSAAGTCVVWCEASTAPGVRQRSTCCGGPPAAPHSATSFSPAATYTSGAVCAPLAGVGSPRHARGALASASASTAACAGWRHDATGSWKRQSHSATQPALLPVSSQLRGARQRASGTHVMALPDPSAGTAHAAGRAACSQTGRVCACSRALLHVARRGMCAFIHVAWVSNVSSCQRSKQQRQSMHVKRHALPTGRPGGRLLKLAHLELARTGRMYGMVWR